ncbi:Hypothetical predicted protein, partial [Pelobates cultripes]
VRLELSPNPNKKINPGTTKTDGGHGTALHRDILPRRSPAQTDGLARTTPIKTMGDH